MLLAALMAAESTTSSIATMLDHASSLNLLNAPNWMYLAEEESRVLVRTTA